MATMGGASGGGVIGVLVISSVPISGGPPEQARERASDQLVVDRAGRKAGTQPWECLGTSPSGY